MKEKVLFVSLLQQPFLLLLFVCLLLLLLVCCLFVFARSASTRSDRETKRTEKPIMLQDSWSFQCRGANNKLNKVTN